MAGYSGILEAQMKWIRLPITKSSITRARLGFRQSVARASRNGRISASVMFRYICLCAFSLLAAQRLDAVTQRALPDGYTRRVWQTQDGLPENTVEAFALTPDHYLWIGTSGEF